MAACPTSRLISTRVRWNAGWPPTTSGVLYLDDRLTAEELRSLFERHAASPCQKTGVLSEIADHPNTPADVLEALLSPRFRRAHSSLALDRTRCWSICAAIQTPQSKLWSASPAIDQHRCRSAPRWVWSVVGPNISVARPRATRRARAGPCPRSTAPRRGTDFDHVMDAHVKPGADFVTRVTPGVGSNEGGAVEVVVTPGGW